MAIEIIVVVIEVMVEVAVVVVVVVVVLLVTGTEIDPPTYWGGGVREDLRVLSALSADERTPLLVEREGLLT